MIDCTGRKVVIFGGGSVGARKVTFFAGEADVTVYSRTFSEAFEDLPVRKERIILEGLSDAAISDLLRDAFLVITATSDQTLNSRIMKICKEMKILVNNADGEQGDVLIPSLIQGKGYILAISTNGNSPAVSRYIREQVQKFLSDELPYLDPMVQLQKRLRTLLKKTVFSQDARSQIIRDVLCDEEVQQMLCIDEEAAWVLTQRRYIV